MNKSAIVIGSSGLVGRQLLHYLLQDKQYNLITIFVRKSLNWKHPNLIEIITDFQNIGSLKEKLIATDIFICTGTTIKKAGSKEVFRKIDLDMPYQIAELAASNKVENLYLISALGASSQSNVFYNAVKGELETLIKKLPFRRICIFQPSLLLGRRNEVRTMETIAQYVMQVLNVLMIGPLKKYKAVHDWQVAKSMLANSKLEANGIYIIANETMVTIKN